MSALRGLETGVSECPMTRPRMSALWLDSHRRVNSGCGIVEPECRTMCIANDEGDSREWDWDREEEDSRAECTVTTGLIIRAAANDATLQVSNRKG